MCVFVLYGNDVELHKSMGFFYGVFFMIVFFIVMLNMKNVDIDKTWEVSLCCVKLMSPIAA